MASGGRPQRDFPLQNAAWLDKVRVSHQTTVAENVAWQDFDSHYDRRVAEEPSWDGSQDQGQGHGGGGGAPAEAYGHKQHADRVYADPWTVSVKKQASEGPMRRRVAPHRAGSAASSRQRVVSHHAHVKPRVTIPVPQTNVKSEQNGHWLWLTRPSINGGVTGVYSREQWAACGGLTTASGSGQDFLCLPFLCLPFFY